MKQGCVGQGGGGGGHRKQVKRCRVRLSRLRSISFKLPEYSCSLTFPIPPSIAGWRAPPTVHLPAALCTRNLCQHKHPDCPVPTLIFLVANWASVSWTVASKKRKKKQSPNVGQGARQKKVLSVPSLQMPQDWVQGQKRLALAFLYPGVGVKGDQGKDRAKKQQRAKGKTCGHSS